MSELTLYQVMMYTCEESELGGVRSYSVTDAKGMIAAQASRSGKPGDDRLGSGATRSADARPAAQKIDGSASGGTPLGRAFRKFIGGK